MMNIPNGLLTSELSREQSKINDEEPNLQQASIFIHESNNTIDKMNISENDIFDQKPSINVMMS